MTERFTSAASLQDIRAAERRLAPHIVRTPLVRLNRHDLPNEIYLKLENLQPAGSFKVRPMGNIMLSSSDDALKYGAYTASSGNAGLGLAWMARELGIRATVYAPASAPQAKLEPIRTYGARVQLMPDEDWWRIIRSRGHSDDSGFYVDAVRSAVAMAGNGTIGVEIVEQLPEVDTVIVPFGGGGLACGIGSALSALKPGVRLVIAECDAAAPASAAWKAGRPVEIPLKTSFVSGAGAPTVLAEMWPLISALVADTMVVSVPEVEAAVGQLSKFNRVVAEGAGAIPVAAALAARGTTGKTVCVVSGGNIDSAIFARIIASGRSDPWVRFDDGACV